MHIDMLCIDLREVVRLGHGEHVVIAIKTICDAVNFLMGV